MNIAYKAFLIICFVNTGLEKFNLRANAVYSATNSATATLEAPR